MDRNGIKKYISIIITILIACFCIIAANSKKINQDNQPPKVIITKPSPNDRFNWNTLISYEINVTDKEDGASAYNEITANEVFLKIVYLPDSTLSKKYLNEDDFEPRALTLMKTSTCFNCHAVKNKLIGPSFDTIVKRYGNNSASVKMLADRVLKGSKLVWSPVEMPPHPELKAGEATEIIRWIMNNSAYPNTDYLVGLEGAFRTKAKPQKNAGKAVYILTASYTDHGLAELLKQQKQGRHTVILRSE